MSTVTLNSFRKEAAGTASPQLAAADAFVGHVSDVTLKLANLTNGQLSAVAALMLVLDGANARARNAERVLATHLNRYICNGFDVADAEVVEDGPTPVAAGVCDELSLMVAA